MLNLERGIGGAAQLVGHALCLHPLTLSTLQTFPADALPCPGEDGLKIAYGSQQTFTVYCDGMQTHETSFRRKE